MAEMMAEPRSSVKYANLLPDDAGWGYAKCQEVTPISRATALKQSMKH